MLCHYLFEVRVLAHQDFSEDLILPYLNCLQANQFQKGQEHTYQRRTRRHGLQHLFEANRAVLKCQAAVQIADHLAHGNRLVIYFKNWPRSRPLQNLLTELAAPLRAQPAGR